MAYNHKTAQKPYSKLLEDNSSEYDLGNKGDKLYDKMLEDERKGNKDHTKDGQLVTEKQLEPEQKTADYEILEKKLNDGSTKLNEFSNKFRNNDGAHPMDYFKEGEKEEKKAYNASKDKNLKKRKMDEIAGEQMIGEKTTIVGNEYKSQLLSNYDSREDFEKKNRAIKKASKELLEADAYLFAIYKTANDAGRDLSEIEQKAVESVTDAKVKVLAQLEGWDDEFSDSDPLGIDSDEFGIATLDEDPLDESILDEDPLDEDPMSIEEEVPGLDLEMDSDLSEPVNIFQWKEQAKSEIEAADVGQYGEIIDRLLSEAREIFDMDFRQAEELIRDEVLSD